MADFHRDYESDPEFLADDVSAAGTLFRYFAIDPVEVDTGVLTIVQGALLAEREREDALNAFLARHGIAQWYGTHSDRLFAAPRRAGDDLFGNDAPIAGWRRVAEPWSGLEEGWLPDERTKAGKSIAADLAAIPDVPDAATLTKALAKKIPMPRRNGHTVTVRGTVLNPVVCLPGLPWNAKPPSGLREISLRAAMAAPPVVRMSAPESTKDLVPYVQRTLPTEIPVQILAASTRKAAVPMPTARTTEPRHLTPPESPGGVRDLLSDLALDLTAMEGVDTIDPNVALADVREVWAFTSAPAEWCWHIAGKGLVVQEAPSAPWDIDPDAEKTFSVFRLPDKDAVGQFRRLMHEAGAFRLPLREVHSSPNPDAEAPAP